MRLHLVPGESERNKEMVIDLKNGEIMFRIDSFEGYIVIVCSVLCSIL